MICDGPELVGTDLVSDDAAILVLGQAGEIVSARGGCVPLLGWEAAELVDQNIRVLLKAGLDNEIGRALHRRRTEKNFTAPTQLRVTVIRKEGLECPASVTTLPLNGGDSASSKTAGKESSPSVWNIALRRVNPPGDCKTQASERGESPDSATARRAASASPADPAVIAAECEALPGDSVVNESSAVELRRRNEELERQLQQASSELEACRSDAERRTQEWQLQEQELRAQLEAARETAGHNEAALKEEIATREKLEERLQTLSHSLREEQIARSQRFEEELVSLRQERDGLNSKLTAEQQAALESTQTAEDLERLLRQNAAEFERARHELEQQSAERQRSESQWREQLDTAWVMKEQLEGAWAGEVERNKRFEEELASLRRESEELNRRLAAEQQAAAEALERAGEVESRLGQNAAESERAQEQLEKEVAERDHSELKWLEQLQAIKDEKKELEADWTAALERNLQFEADIASVREQRDALETRLKAEDRLVSGCQERAEELQGCLDRAQADLEQTHAQLRQHQADREQVEADWNKRLAAAQALAKKLETAWTGTVERNKRYEEELGAVRRERDTLIAKLAGQEQSTIDFRIQLGHLEEQLSRQTSEVNRLQALLKHGNPEANGVRAGMSGRVEEDKVPSGEGRRGNEPGKPASNGQRQVEEATSSASPSPPTSPGGKMYNLKF